jgi:cytochrome c-type biogenesis protein CcmH/NrfG
MALQPLLVLSALYEGAGQDGQARGKLVQAVRLQPQNYAAWLALGSFDVRHHHAALAIGSLQRAYTLDPEFVPTSDELAQARSMLSHG